jgi:hypothetical protein
MIFCRFRILLQTEWLIRQYCVQNITFSSPSLLDHNEDTVSVREDEAFVFTQKGLKIQNEW